jgi:urease accessory protein
VHTAVPSLQSVPAADPSRPSGWTCTELSVGLRRGANGTVRVEGQLCSAPVWFRWDGATLWLVGSGASPVGEDHIRVRVEVGPGVDVAVRSVAATVLYAARGEGTRWHTEIVVDEGARLDWRPEPMILTERARHHASTVVHASSGAEVTLDETVVLGRAGERTGALCSSLEVHLDRTTALQTSFDTTVPGWSGPGGVGAHGVVASRLLLGPDAHDSADSAARAGAVLLAPAEGCRVALAVGDEVDATLGALSDLLTT